MKKKAKTEAPKKNIAKTSGKKALSAKKSKKATGGSFWGDQLSGAGVSSSVYNSSNFTNTYEQNRML